MYTAAYSIVVQKYTALFFFQFSSWQKSIGWDKLMTSQKGNSDSNRLFDRPTVASRMTMAREKREERGRERKPEDPVGQGLPWLALAAWAVRTRGWRERGRNVPKRATLQIAVWTAAVERGRERHISLSPCIASRVMFSCLVKRNSSTRISLLAAGNSLSLASPFVLWRVFSLQTGREREREG